MNSGGNVDDVRPYIGQKEVVTMMKEKSPVK